MSGVSKSFPGVRALDAVDLELERGEVHVVVGENGAGKSTLMKILAGAYRADAGEMLLDGRPYLPTDPEDGLRHGISLIYQEDQLLPGMSVMENVLLGRWPSRRGVVDWGDARRQTSRLLSKLGIDLPPHASVADLGSAQKQMVEIARALSIDARVIVMDEPTASLSDREIERLFEIIGELKRTGVGFLYVSHRLDELHRVGDHVTVLRDGKAVFAGPLSSVATERLIGLIVGRPLDAYFPSRSARVGEIALRVQGVRRAGVLTDITFDVRAGEVLGVAGLVGSGRTEMARAVFGADPPDGGLVEVGGRSIRLGSPRSSVDAGLVLVPEERKTQGLVLPLPVVDNIALPNLEIFGRGGWFDWRRARRDARHRIESLQIRTPHLGTPVESLSGGNQQKIVIAKWLARDPRVVIFDEPTKGIDVGGKVEVYRVINALAETGVAIVLISSELPEVLALSDRVLVMRGGRIAGALDAVTATQEQVFALAVGRHVDAA